MWKKICFFNVVLISILAKHGTLFDVLMFLCLYVCFTCVRVRVPVRARAKFFGKERICRNFMAIYL